MSVELNLTAKNIYEKEFKKSRVKGYSEDDVNDYLDLIIEDYMKLDKLLTRIKELEIENQNLKIKIDALKNVKKDEKPNQVTNLDILKRLSKLEIAVFGPNNKENENY
ncbi:DivIVA domain-containing protein [Gemella morbillorum]|jgi:cell cycle protein gpsB|uniref:DivIVA domain-containing protein n=1 Tax=Gemella morbillorum TaxID=29391 RepID=UPI0025518214|nr:DivIVA domain-containing protein [Gemella morbillorum]MDK8240358.1 DivIVA domain-containing protein [Gemella morbillorum]MDK8255439.1 DivIVA domain-containing protein [Gemella morbillorum]